MSVIRPKFLSVQTEDIRHGYDGACVLALVRYVTSYESESNGRRLIDGEMWWVATYGEIGEALGGVNRYSVGRTVRRLESDEALQSRCLDGYTGDQTKAFRVAPDQQSAESHTRADQQSAESHEPPNSKVRNRTDPVRKRTPPGAKSHRTRCEIALSSSSVEELREEEEIEGGERARVTAPAPQPDTAVTADLLPATQTNGPPSGLYTSLHAQVQELGRLPWCCPQHPFGTDTNCRSCKYFGMDFESSQTGLALIEDHAMKTNAARRRGKHLAPIAETAAMTGRTVDEQQQRIARMLDGMAQRNGRAVTGPDQKALDWMDLGRQEQR